MPLPKRDILQPRYVGEFKCIGGACEDNCCDGTKVSVDKKTYLKLKRVKNESFSPLFDKFIKRERDGSVKSDDAYASITADSNVCPFQNADKLCAVQSELGCEYLCDACATYPRLYKITDKKKLERGLTLSCPEAARTALSNSGGIAFETVAVNPTVDRVPPRAPSLNSQSKENAAKTVKFFWEIRLFCLTLLQNRSYTPGQRLVLLGILFKQMEDLEKTQKISDIPSLLESYGNAIENKTIKPDLDKIDNNFEIQARLAKELTDERLKTGASVGPKYLTCVAETLLGLNIIAGTPSSEIVAKYRENLDTYVTDYMKEHAYVLENYIVNEFFTRLMPFDRKTIWDSYLYLCALYGMVKLHLNGMAGFHKGLNNDIVFRIIQTLAKTAQRNETFIPNMIKSLKESGHDTLAWMTILVND